mmetsp:Transcript_85005/g.133761  ORF Transcript_85005/g.133761 Transcript_85005/m.133761 type:complete len:134 (+) Transcript_85005:3-404(+)
MLIGANITHKTSMASKTQDHAQSNPIKRIDKGRLVSEASLWMPWVHVGDLCSTDHGQCFAICTLDLIAALERHPASLDIFSCYAQRFVRAARCANHAAHSARMIELMDVLTVLEMEDSTSTNSFSDLNHSASA